MSHQIAIERKKKMFSTLDTFPFAGNGLNLFENIKRTFLFVCFMNSY